MPRNRKISGAAAGVFILCLVTGSIVADDLVKRVQEDKNSIVLERSDHSFPFLSISGNQRLSLKETGNATEREIWEDKTNVDIFHMNYSNKTGEITVKSNGSDKVIAPGTSDDYHFTIRNREKSTADYSMWMEAQIRPEGTKLPVTVRVSGPEADWLLGSDQSWEDALGLNTVKTEGSLKSGEGKEYIISWQWPFERGMDEQDTLLGNNGAQEDLSLSVTIYTQATWNETGSSGGSGGGSSSGNRRPTSVKETTAETLPEESSTAETVPETTGALETAADLSKAQGHTDSPAPGEDPDAAENSRETPDNNTTTSEAGSTDAEETTAADSLQVTENGTGFEDEKAEDTAAGRPLSAYVKAAASAIAAGAAGIAVLTPIILIPWRRGLYLTGIAAAEGSLVYWKKKKALIRSGRFVFNRICPGKHTFEFCDETGKERTFEWKLKRDRGEGVRIETEDGLPVVIAGKNIRALELYLDTDGAKIRINHSQWAAIDTDKVVYTPEGTTAPQSDGTNRTPGGLKVDQNKKFTVEEELK